MNTILDALQEGRLFELPENDKAHALQFLAHIIEAFPETPAGTDIVGLVMKREAATNTAIGKGWACPHSRVPYDEDLMCVMGWSPKGIDYGAPDGRPVILVVMYLVPDNQRNHYLREVSMLAKAIGSYPDLDKLYNASDLDDVRNHLLDLIESTKGSIGPDVRAKMIRLQTKPVIETIPFHDLSNLIVEPVTIIAGSDIKHIVLSQNAGLTEWLDGADNIVEKLTSEGVYQNGQWRVVCRGVITYQCARTAYDCLAVGMIANPALSR